NDDERARKIEIQLWRSSELQVPVAGVVLRDGDFEGAEGFFPIGGAATVREGEDFGGSKSLRRRISLTLGVKSGDYSGEIRGQILVSVEEDKAIWHPIKLGNYPV
ncbi:hypothetical protein U1Q18_046754, partial [Sarracenia purpurea var. burkii]